MGDRSNVVIVDGTSKVFLYTHWAGSELPEIVRKALASDVGRRRWNDGTYLARIIFCEMVKDDVGGEHGYGISSIVGDNTIGRPLILVDIDRQRVEPADEDGKPVKGNGFTFTEYAALDKVEWVKFGAKLPY